MVHLLFRRDRCKGCGLCISVCPRQLLALEPTPNAKGYRPVGCLDEGACIGCASCARICPDSIITITKEEGVAPNEA